MKKHFTLVLLLSLVALPSFAANAIFSSNEVETINLKPVNYNFKPLISAAETTSSNSLNTSVKNSVQTKANNGKLSEQNFMKAVNNLDTAQVELREQISGYSSLMNQSKSEYLSKKEEYKAYKKQYNALKKKMKKIEKSKKLIQDNIESQNVNY